MKHSTKKPFGVLDYDKPTTMSKRKLTDFFKKTDPAPKGHENVCCFLKAHRKRRFVLDFKKISYLKKSGEEKNTGFSS